MCISFEKISKRIILLGLLTMLLVSFAMLKEGHEYYSVILLPIMSMILITFVYCFEEKAENPNTVRLLYATYIFFIIFIMLLQSLFQILCKETALYPLWFVLSIHCILSLTVGSLTFPKLCSKGDREALLWMMNIWLIIAVAFGFITIAGSMLIDPNTNVSLSKNIISIIFPILACISMLIFIVSYKKALSNYINRKHN